VLADTELWNMLSAFGALVAALTAIGALIYVEHVKPNRRRPRLTPHLVNGRPEFEASVCPHNVIEHWLRIRISAQKERDTAQDVEVIFVGMRCRQPKTLKPTEPRALRWSATTITPLEHGKRVDPLSNDAPEPLMRMRIAAGSYRYVDVIHASDNPVLDATQRRQPRICTRPFHPDRHILEQGEYDLYFVVTASNCETTYFQLPISWNGGWADTTAWFSQLKCKPPRVIEDLPADL
jgi:hypothetical protein